jgi:hypothetical protein
MLRRVIKATEFASLVVVREVATAG